MFYKSKVLRNIESDIYNMPVITDKEKLAEEAIGKKAYEDGFVSGEKAGEQKAAILIESLEKLIEEFTAFSGNLVEDLEQQVLALSSAIARKIIIEEISLNPEVIVTMVKEALKRLQRTGSITIKVNPAIYDLLTEKKPELIKIREGVILDVDPHLPVTGPLIIGEAEEIVTDIDSLLTNIMEEMKKADQPQTDIDQKDAEN